MDTTDDDVSYLLLLSPELQLLVLEHLPPYSVYAFASLSYHTFCLVRDFLGLVRADAFRAMAVAAKVGDLTLLRWLVGLQLWPCYALVERCLADATEHGHLAVLAFLKSAFPKVSVSCIEYYIPDVATLQWLEENRPSPFTRPQIQNIFQHALQRGRVGLAVHLFEQAPRELSLTEWNSAAHNGCLAALLPLSLSWAAVHDKANILEWLGSLGFYTGRLKVVLESERVAEWEAVKLLLLEVRTRVADDYYQELLSLFFQHALRSEIKDKFVWLLQLNEQFLALQPQDFFLSRVFCPGQNTSQPGLLPQLFSDVHLCRTIFQLLGPAQAVKLFHFHSMKWTDGQYVQLPVAQFLLEQGHFLKQGSACLKHLVAILCLVGELDYLRWLHAVVGLQEQDFLVPTTRQQQFNAVACAAVKSHLSVLQWLDATFGAGFVLKSLPAEYRVKSGPVLMWLHEQGYPVVAEKMWKRELSEPQPSVTVLQWILKTFPQFQPDVDVTELLWCGAAVRSFLGATFFPTRSQLFAGNSLLVLEALCWSQLELLQWIHRQYRLTPRQLRLKFLIRACAHTPDCVFLLRWVFLTFPSLSSYWPHLKKQIQDRGARQYLEQFITPTRPLRVLPRKRCRPG